jgi:radical SAM protein with 4Fe4S-binding SPASM domain
MNTLTKLKNKSRSIQLTGGEPMLYDRFFEILDYCKNNFRTNITTSATYINDSNVENFKGVQFVQVSLYSEKEWEHEEITQVKESYKNTIKGIKHLVNNKIPTNVATIATKNNINKMEDMIKFLINIGVKGLSVGLVSKWGRALQLDDSWTLNSEEKSRISDTLEELNIKYKKYITVSTWKNKDIILNEDNKARLSCGAGLLTWVISEKGTIKPCEFFPDSLFSVGNIFEEDIEEIVNKYTLENMSKGITQWETELRQNNSSLRDICQIIEQSRRN